MSNILSQARIAELYGKPGDLSNLVTVELPYSYLLDWDLTKSVKRITCHRLIADRWIEAEKEVLEVYGQAKITELGIDQYGGCFIYRPQRGYETQFAAAIERGDIEEAQKYLSKHAWGVAFDKDPNRNTLRETKRTARFARDEYKDMLDIYYKHGFLSYGREKDFDWMHIETAI